MHVLILRPRDASLFKVLSMEALITLRLWDPVAYRVNLITGATIETHVRYYNGATVYQ